MANINHQHFEIGEVVKVNWTKIPYVVLAGPVRDHHGDLHYWIQSIQEHANDDQPPISSPAAKIFKPEDY